MSNLVLLSKVKDEVGDVKELLKLPFERQFYLIDSSANFAVKSLIENAIFDARSNLSKFIRYEFCPFIYHDGAESMLLHLAYKNKVLAHKDWVVKLDAKERISEEYYNILKMSIPKLIENNILHLYKRSKLQIWCYYEDMFFIGSPHPSLANRRGNGLDITTMNGWDESYIFHTKQKDHMFAWIVSGFKYYCDPISNQINLVYSADSGRGSEETIKIQIQNRYIFRDLCRKYNIDPNFDDLTNYFKDKVSNGTLHKIPMDLLNIMNHEYIIKNYLRYLMNHDMQIIKKEENMWNLIDYIQNNEKNRK